MGTDRKAPQAAEEPAEAPPDLTDTQAENEEGQKQIRPGRYLETVKGRVTCPRKRTRNASLPIRRVNNKI